MLLACSQRDPRDLIPPRELLKCLFDDIMPPSPSPASHHLQREVTGLALKDIPSGMNPFQVHLPLFLLTCILSTQVQSLIPYQLLSSPNSMLWFWLFFLCVCISFISSLGLCSPDSRFFLGLTGRVSLFCDHVSPAGSTEKSRSKALSAPSPHLACEVLDTWPSCTSPPLFRGKVCIKSIFFIVIDFSKTILSTNMT